ncbi:MAG: hypothetical protein ACRD1K_11750 [Acidimicrobiales bacterium]
MANLYLSCKSCGKQFFSGVQQPPPDPRTHECLWCHEAPVYKVADYIVAYTDADLDAAAGAHHG